MSPMLQVSPEEATLEDVRVAARAALDRAGLSEEELRDQASSGDFQSLSARIAWVVVSDLDPESTT